MYGHGNHLVQWCETIRTNYQYLFNRKSRVNSGEVQFSGPSCSKLTTSLVNDSLKFTSSDTQIC